MPGSQSFLLFRKLCRHNRRMPSIGATKTLEAQVALKKRSEFLASGNHVAVELFPEPQNLYDLRAIAFVNDDWHTIGYVVREISEYVHDAIAKKKWNHISQVFVGPNISLFVITVDQSTILAWMSLFSVAGLMLLLRVVSLNKHWLWLSWTTICQFCLILLIIVKTLLPWKLYEWDIS